MDLINLNCMDCDLCTTRRNVVPGEGPLDAELMFVAEAPGSWEDEKGVPLYKAAKTGSEYTWLLMTHGMQRHEVYTTNVVKCWPPGNRNPRDSEITACSQWLQLELATVKPRFIIAMGYYAANWFLKGVTLESVHGIPFHWGDNQVVIPTYHVAAGFHKPDILMNIQLDFRAVREIIKGNRPTRHIEDAYKGSEQYYVLTNGDLDQ